MKIRKIKFFGFGSEEKDMIQQWTLQQLAVFMEDGEPNCTWHVDAADPVGQRERTIHLHVIPNTDLLESCGILSSKLDCEVCICPDDDTVLDHTRIGVIKLQ